MTAEHILLDLNPSGMEIIKTLRRTPDEAPEIVILRALALMGAVQEYMEEDSLFVMDPRKPPNEDIVELVFEDNSAAKLTSEVS